MPRERTAYKELRKARVRHFRNISLKSELKTFAKHFEKLVSDKKTEEAKSQLKQLVSKISRAASKGVIKRNTASRKISHLMKRLLAKT